MTKRFEMKLSDEEFEQLAKEAKERNISMKDVVYEAIQRGTLKDGERIGRLFKSKSKKETDQIESDLIKTHTVLDPKKEWTLDDVNPSVKRAIDQSRSWLGGYDWEKAARNIAVMYEWNDLQGPDLEYFLGSIQFNNVKHGIDPEYISKQFEILGQIFQIDPKPIKESYRKIKVVEKENGWNISTV